MGHPCLQQSISLCLLKYSCPAYWVCSSPRWHKMNSCFFYFPLLYSSSVVPKCHYCLGSAWGPCLVSGAPPQRVCSQVPAVRLGSPDYWQASRASEAALNDFEPIWFGQQVRLQARHSYFSTSNASCAYFIYFLVCQGFVWIQIFPAPLQELVKFLSVNLDLLVHTVFLQQGHETIVWKPIITLESYMLIQQLFIDHLLCARHWAKYQRSSRKQERWDLCRHILMQETWNGVGKDNMERNKIVSHCDKCNEENEQGFVGENLRGKHNLDKRDTNQLLMEGTF